MMNIQPLLTDLDFFKQNEKGYAAEISSLQSEFAELNTFGESSPHKTLIEAFLQRAQEKISLARRLAAMKQQIMVERLAREFNLAKQIIRMLKQGASADDANLVEALQEFGLTVPATAKESVPAPTTPTAAAPALPRREEGKFSKLSSILGQIFEILLNLLLKIVEGIKANPEKLFGNLLGGLFGGAAPAAAATSTTGPQAKPTADEDQDPDYVSAEEYEDEDQDENYEDALVAPAAMVSQFEASRKAASATSSSMAVPAATASASSKNKLD